MDNSPTVAWMKNAQGQYVYINRQFEAVFHVTLAQMLGKTDVEWMPTEAAHALRANDQAILASGMAQENTERVPTPDGVLHHWQAVKFPIQDASGEWLVGGVAVDVTARVQAQEQLRQAHWFAQRIADASPSVLYIYDLKEQRNIYANREVAPALGYSPEQIKAMGSALLDTLMHPEDVEAVRQSLARFAHAADGDVLETEYRMRHADGSWHWFRSRDAIFLRDANGTPTQIVGSAQDVTERKWFDEQIAEQIAQVNEMNVELHRQRQELAVANAQLQALATTDGLTGLKNHRAFQEFLQMEFQRAIRHPAPFSVILLDVDNFKDYNDAFGHPAGDEVLKAVAQALKQEARRSDLAARYGGEEFVLVLPDTDSAGALVTAERLRQGVEALDHLHHPVTASFGVATWTPAINRAALLVEQADQAMYVSKRQGRNRVSLFEAN